LERWRLGQEKETVGRSLNEPLLLHKYPDEEGRAIVAKGDLIAGRTGLRTPAEPEDQASLGNGKDKERVEDQGCADLCEDGRATIRNQSPPQERVGIEKGKVNSRRRKVQKGTATLLPGG